MTAAEYFTQQGVKRGKIQGKVEGKVEGKQEVAVNALQKGFSIEMVVDLTGLDINIVERLKQNLDTNDDSK